MAVSYIATHANDAVSRLADLQGTDIEALVRAFGNSFQALEDAAFPLVNGLSLSGLYGAALDLYGERVGVARNGLDDDTYRAVLYGSIGSQYSDGTPQVLTTALLQLFDAAAIFVKDPSSYGQAGAQGNHNDVAFGIGSPHLPVSQYPYAIATFQNALPAGEGLYYLSTFDAAGVFACDGPQAWVRGCGDLNDPTAGAPCADLIYNNPVL
ncbi:MAG: hypothetical protein EOP64_00345 [Sphingomonas sp.]|nr:MAG: hypothetical protein EOP64_00345 [Sphingomonas sp.]